MSDLWCTKCHRYTGPFHRCFVFPNSVKPRKKPPADIGCGVMATEIINRLKNDEVIPSWLLHDDARAVRSNTSKSENHNYTAWTVTPEGRVWSQLSMTDLLKYTNWEVNKSGFYYEVSLSPKDHYDLMVKKGVYQEESTK